MIYYRYEEVHDAIIKEEEYTMNYSLKSFKRYKKESIELLLLLMKEKRFSTKILKCMRQTV